MSIATPQQHGLARLWKRPTKDGRHRIPSVLVIGFAAACVYIVAAEIVVRVASGTSLLRFEDLRQAYVQHDALNASLVFDPLLGWKLKPFVKSSNFNTLDYGFRSNGNGHSKVKPGDVLAVGSSFTAGSEVLDHESWPAFLEQLLDRTVNNAGVGGYGADQIILNAEYLIPILKPDTIVVDFLADNILATAYSSYGRPKPYFTTKGGKLVHHNDPVPDEAAKAKEIDPLKSAFGHSVLADRFLDAFFPDYWNTGGASHFTKTGVDDVEITCRLLQRLKRTTDAEGIRLLLFLQFAGSHIIGVPNQPGHSVLVGECAKEAGIQVLNEYDHLKQMEAGNIAELRSNYVPQPDGTTGHKSAHGNLEVAERIKLALAAPEPEPIDLAVNTDASFAAIRPEDQINLIPRSENLHTIVGSSSHAKFSGAFAWWFQDRVYSIEARGETGEHYISLNGLMLKSGPAVASLEVKPDGTERFRMQFRTASGEGLIVDANLKDSSRQNARLGKARNIGSTIEDIGGGWFRIFMKATLGSADEGPSSLILQMADAEGNTNFAPLGESILVRRLQVMNGYEVAPYEPSGEN